MYGPTNPKSENVSVFEQSWAARSRTKQDRQYRHGAVLVTPSSIHFVPVSFPSRRPFIIEAPLTCRKRDPKHWLLSEERCQFWSFRQQILVFCTLEALYVAQFAGATAYITVWPVDHVDCYVVVYCVFGLNNTSQRMKCFLFAILSPLTVSSSLEWTLTPTAYKVDRCSCHVLVIFSDFNLTGVTSADWNQSPQYNISRNSVQWQSSRLMRTDGRTDGRTDRQTDRQTDRHYATAVAFCSFLNSHNSKVTMLYCTTLPDFRKHVAVFEGPLASPACPNTSNI